MTRWFADMWSKGLSLRRKPGRLAARAGYGAALVLAACATASAPGRPPVPPPPAPGELALNFSLAEPQEGSLGRDLKLWATHYHTPVVTPAPPEISSSITLIDRNNRDISPRLRHSDWCKAALQGTVSIVEADGKVTAYAFLDSKGPEQANCDNQLGNLSDTIKLATRKARFVKVNHPYGCGVRSIPLMPFRTIATDPALIPVGSVVYVPALRGRTFSLRGQTFTHDGYLFAGDRGGAIKGAHIDVFHGNKDDTPFEDIFASRESKTFEARVVRASDPAAKALTDAQGGHCDPVSN